MITISDALTQNGSISGASSRTCSYGRQVSSEQNTRRTGHGSLLATLMIFLSLCFSLLSFAPKPALAASFSDLQGNWASSEIVKAVDTGFIKGYPDGTFAPGTGVTRAEFVSMVDSAFQVIAAQGPETFRDVLPGDWFSGSVQAAAKSGLVSGYPGNTFRPQQMVDRQQAACILAQVLNLQGGGSLNFIDGRQISGWARPSVSQLAAGGIVAGYPDGTFRPGKTITRAEAVAIINHALASRIGPQVPAPSRSDPGTLAISVRHDQYGETVDISVVQGWVYNTNPTEQQDPQRLVVTIPGVTVVRTPLEIPVGEGGVDKVTTSFTGTGPGTAQVEISFAAPVPLTYYTTPGQPGELQITVPPQIYKIEAVPVSDFLAVNLSATGPLNFQTSSQDSSTQLALDFPGIGLSPGLLQWQQQVNAAGIVSLQLSEPQPFTTRLAIQASQAITCSSDSSDQGPQMVLRLREGAIPAQPVRQGGQGSLAGKCVVLDPGHGGDDPGATGPHGVEEKSVTLPIASRAADILRQEGANVIMTRTGDTNPDLYARPELANDNNADVFVSIHANFIRNSSIGGTGTYVYAPPDTSLEQQRTARLHLANCLQGALVRTLGLHDRGIFEDELAVLRCSDMPSALVEVAFISNPREERLLNNPSFQQQAAAAIASAITQFLTGG